MFWVSKQSLFDQANTTCWNIWMKRLQNKIKELRRDLNLLESSKARRLNLKSGCLGQFVVL